MKFKDKMVLKNPERDINGNLCCEAIKTHDGKVVAYAGQCQWEGLIVIERGMEYLFEFREKS